MPNNLNETMNKANNSALNFQSKVQSGEKNLEKIVHNAGERIGSITSDLASSASKLAKSAADYTDAGRDYVRQNPAKGVAIAAAAGLVVGGFLALTLRRS